METLKQITKDYEAVMHGFQFNPLFCETERMNPHVHFEEFSVYDKTLISKSTASIP